MLAFPSCECFDACYPAYPSGTTKSWAELRLHDEAQETGCDAWELLLAMVEAAAEDGREKFDPLRGLSDDQRIQIITLPPTIAKLTRVKHLELGDSFLVRIPPEVGEMVSLEKFTPYGSHRLHWFPYELSRCTQLRDSAVSTRALYGNYKYRPPFPRLPQVSAPFTPECCSVCHGAFRQGSPVQAWISLSIGTDILPLLVHACSEHCLRNLPPPAPNYVALPHQGGLDLRQPAPRF